MALRNEMPNYTSSRRSIRNVPATNEIYTSCPLYKRLGRDIGKYLLRTILAMKRRGELPEDSVIAIARRFRQG